MVVMSHVDLFQFSACEILPKKMQRLNGIGPFIFMDMMFKDRPGQTI